jgi:hypothetical protein
MKRVLHAIILFFLILTEAAYADDVTIVDCTTSDCTIKVFRNDAPDIMSQVEASLKPPLPINATNIANIGIDGATIAVTCDDTWHDLPSSDPQLQNRIKCTVETGGTGIRADLTLYDQKSFIKTYNDQPSLYGFSNLEGTSEGNPYCVTETSPENANACQWEEQLGNGNWVIVSKTDAYGLLIGTTDGGGPGSGTVNNGNICSNDTDNNGSIDSGEWGQCPFSDNSTTDKICLLDAVECIDSISDPICLDGGVFNSVTKNCEMPPSNITCLNNFTFNNTTDKCEQNPYCTNNGVFDATDKRCEIIVSNSCPTDYTFDINLDACVKIPDCAGAGIYDQGADACVSQVISECPNGFMMNGNICERSPVCSATGLIYNSGLDRCVDDAILSCPNGYSVQGNICVKNPECPSGGSYNSLTNRCEILTSYCVENEPEYVAHFRVVNNGGDCVPGVGVFGSGDDWQTVTYSTNGAFGVNYKGKQIPHDTNTPSGNIVAHNEMKNHYLIPNNNGYTMSMCLTYITDIEKINNSSGNYLCVIAGANSGSYDTLANCEASCPNSCPGGYTENSGLCVANPSCSDGGIFNTATDQCEITTTPTCPPGSVYDAGLLYCVETPSCGSGSLNTATDLCEIVPTNSCPVNYYLDGSICKSPAICSFGSYNNSLDLCEMNVSTLCPTDYTYDVQNKVCTKNYTCFYGAVYSDTQNMCELEADHTCASNYQYNSTTKMCSAIPICNVGAFDPNTSKCFEAQNTCPYGPQYTCKPYLGKNMCSQYDCIQVAGNETNTDTATGVDDKTNDDALIDPNGSCLGNIYFYNGKDSRCRSWGVSLVGSGCCNHKTYLMGTMDCDPDEKQLSMQRSQKLCHYVGEYDSKHIDLGFSEIATEKKKTYCCFNSILARIIHEQGRPQLIKFSTEGWGTPKNPNCRGFTPEEFQMIDFNKINMDEWTGQIATKNNEAINTDVQNSINEFYNH